MPFCATRFVFCDPKNVNKSNLWNIFQILVKYGSHVFASQNIIMNHAKQLAQIIKQLVIKQLADNKAISTDKKTIHFLSRLRINRLVFNWRRQAATFLMAKFNRAAMKRKARFLFSMHNSIITNGFGFFLSHGSMRPDSSIMYPKHSKIFIKNWN